MPAGELPITTDPSAEAATGRPLIPSDATPVSAVQRKTAPLSSLMARQSTGTFTFVSTIDLVDAAQRALDGGDPLNLLIVARDQELAATNLNLRVRSDDATTGARPLLSIAYTLSRAKTSSTNDRDAVDNPQNPLDLEAEYAVARTDRTARR